MKTLAKRRQSKRLEERVREGKCILEGCDRPIESRGLCAYHRQVWYRRLWSRPSDKDRAEFERRSVELGLILAPGEQQELQRDDPFAEALQ